MCLITEQRTPKVSDKELITYKILYDRGNIPQAPFYGNPYQLDVEYKKDSTLPPFNASNDNVITEQGYHVFTNLRDALTVVQIWELVFNDPHSLKIYKATIPAGSIIYEGYCVVRDVVYPSIVTNRIIISKLP